MILGHPQLRPSDVFGIFLLYLKYFILSNYPMSIVPINDRCILLGSDARVPPSRKGEGSSGRSSLARIQDDMFLRVVDETLAQARANPDEYTLTAEEVRLLARDVVEGDSSLPSDHPIARETRHAIIRVAVEVLNNIYKKNGPGAAKVKLVSTILFVKLRFLHFI